jgi:hypothetical protein
VKTLIDRIADKLGLPDVAPVSPVKRDRVAIEREITLVRQLHRLNAQALFQAQLAEESARATVRHNRTLVAETQVRLELLITEIGLEMPPAGDDVEADEHEDGVPA